MSDIKIKNGIEYEVSWKKPNLKDKAMHYCPGCGHGTIENMMQEVIDEMGIDHKTVGVACNRGENIVIFFYNNAIYGMTGGQMAPTSLPGQVTSSSPHGRDTKTAGMPMKMAEMVAALPGTCYVTRTAVNNPANVRKFKKATQIAFQNCLDKKGTSFIEVAGNCPSGWKMTTLESYEWWKENMLPTFPLGDVKTEGGK